MRTGMLAGGGSIYRCYSRIDGLLLASFYLGNLRSVVVGKTYAIGMVGWYLVVGK